MIVFFDGFWGGFFEKTNAVHVDFFLDLLRNVYDEPIEIGTFETSDILVDNTQVNNSHRTKKVWRHTYLFSGESYIREDFKEYDCVLYGKRTHDNIVNCPLYIPYTACSKLVFSSGLTSVPSKQAVVIITNPAGSVRKSFLERLEREMDVVYAGNYKNNIGGALKFYYNSQEFVDFIKDYKFVVSMENSELDTYITEKICHGLYAGNVPVYWGSPRVKDYFNESRILRLENLNYDGLIRRMKTMTDKEWLDIARAPIFNTFGKDYTTCAISKEIKNLLFSKEFPLLKQVYVISNKEFEPSRYSRCLNMLRNLGLKDENMKFVCPTYKHILSDYHLRKYRKSDKIRYLGRDSLRRGELSLILNYRSVMEDIEMRYLGGKFLVLESDSYTLANINDFNVCLQFLNDKEWNLIHVGSRDGPETFPWGPANLVPWVAPNYELMKHIATVDNIRLESGLQFIRKFHTNCTDSLLWSYTGVQTFLNHMKTNEDYSVPFDYYVIEKAYTDMSFRYYWCIPGYFNQESNNNLTMSTLKTDIFNPE